MSKPLWCVTLLIVLFPALLFGQSDERVIIEGMVVDADSAQALPSVHIRVRNTPLGGVTGKNGRFKTRVHRTDSLVFSSVGYQPFLLVLADSTSESLTRLVIRMQPQITMLDEVKIKEYIDITKYIRRDIDSTIDMRRPKGTPLFERPTPQARKSVQVGVGPNGATLEGAITAFANLFSSEFQQQKKVKELLAIEEERDRYQAIEEAMTQRYQTMVLTATTLDNADLQRFTEAHMPHPMAMIDMSDYEVMEGIVLNLKEFDTKDEFLKDLLNTGTFEGEEHTQ